MAKPKQKIKEHGKAKELGLQDWRADESGACTTLRDSLLQKLTVGAAQKPL
jgi:hypothetical protein